MTDQKEEPKKESDDASLVSEAEQKSDVAGSLADSADDSRGSVSGQEIPDIEGGEQSVTEQQAKAPPSEPAGAATTESGTGARAPSAENTPRLPVEAHTPDESESPESELPAESGPSEDDAPAESQAQVVDVKQKSDGSGVESKKQKIASPSEPKESSDEPVTDAHAPPDTVTPRPRIEAPTPGEPGPPESELPAESQAQVVDVKQKSDDGDVELKEQKSTSPSALKESGDEPAAQSETRAEASELHKLREENDKLRIENEQLRKAAAERQLVMKNHVERASSLEKLDIEQDQKELDEHFEELKHWRKRVSVLREDLKTAAGKFRSKPMHSQYSVQGLSQSVQEALESRQKGLELINKMLCQQIDRGETALPVDEDPSREFPTVGKDVWWDVVSTPRGDDDSEVVEKIQKDIRRKLKEIGQKRYQVITTVREAKEKCRKGFLTFAEKQLLPVLDSIDDGEEHSRQLVEKLKAENPGVEEQLDKWFETYNALRTSLLGVLENVGIYPMVVEPGKPIQYDRHEPFDTESDPKLENESIKSTTRKGYEYKSPGGAERLVLRPAQVIVVKNNKE